MKPARGALRNNIPGYAGGGLIDGFKRAVGMAPAETMREKFARQDAERAAKQPPAPAPTTSPAGSGQTAVTSYAAGTLTGDRKKQMEEAIGKKVGGAIRGKGTGTSDDIPIMASNGEFMIKAKAVKAIGIEVLEALNAIADKPDEKDSKEEAAREYGEGSESPVHEKAEDKVEGMKCGGAVRKMAKGGLVNLDPAVSGYGPNTTEGMAARQAAYQNQLSSANTLAANNLGKGSLPTAATVAPAAVDPMAAHNAALASAQALATARASGANPTVASESAGRDAYLSALDASKSASSSPYFKQQTPTSQQDVTNTNQAASGALRNVYGTPAPVAQVAAPAPQGTPAAAPVQATAQPAAQKPAGVAPAPTATPATGGDIPTAPVPNAAIGKDVGYGATRIDTPGKSPLFTNVTNAADNANLQGRAQITAQNQGALDGFQVRQDATDARNKLLADGAAVYQRAADSSALQQLAARAVLEKQGASPKEKAAISQRTADAERALQSDVLARRQQDITAKGQDVQAGALRASQKLAQDKFAMDQKSRQQLMDAQQEYLNAKTPNEQKSAEKKLITLGDKQGKAPTFHPGSRIKNVDGSETVTPAYVFDPSTGQAQEVQPGAQQAAPAGQHPAPTTQDAYNKLPKGAKYVHPDGTTRTKG